MAFRDVSANPEEMGEGAEYPKFNALGDKVAGLFIETYEQDDQFNPGKKRLNYKFKGRKADGTPGTLIITPTAHLARSLDGAQLKRGDKVIMELIAEKDVGKDSPMKIFKVLVEDGKPGAAPAAQAKPVARPAAQPQRQAAPAAQRQPPKPAADPFDFDAPPAAAGDDDIPF